jgi:hypothetical protein
MLIQCNKVFTTNTMRIKTVNAFSMMFIMFYSFHIWDIGNFVGDVKFFFKSNIWHRRKMKRQCPNSWNGIYILYFLNIWDNGNFLGDMKFFFNSNIWHRRKMKRQYPNSWNGIFLLYSLNIWDNGNFLGDMKFFFNSNIWYHRDRVMSQFIIHIYTTHIILVSNEISFI